MDFPRELRRAALPLVVLGLLAEDALYGYELAHRLQARSGGMLAVAEGTLYPLLRRLESQHLLEARWVATEHGVPPRRYYSLSSEGKTEYARLSAAWGDFARVIGRFLARGGGDAVRLG